MGLFSRNPNETAYVGGKKHWADVIKNSGPGEALIWRQPEEDFNTNSTLIVMPGEQAIFIKGGVIEYVFDNGTYKLTTENYPFISRLKNAFTGGISTFSCIVYFVRTAHSREVLWGTSSRIQTRDKVNGIRVDIGANGAYKIQIVNPAAFLEKMIGNNVPVQTEDDLQNYFKNEFSGKIRTSLSKFFNEYQGEFIGIEEHLEELSEQLQPEIDRIVSSYGLQCVRFTIAALDVATEKYDRLDDINIGVFENVQTARGEKAAKDAMGADYATIKGMHILESLAQNPAAGGVAGFQAGMAMGQTAATVYSTIAENVFGSASQAFVEKENAHMSERQPSGRYMQQTAATQNLCSKCGVPVPAGANFCPKCGMAISSNEIYCPSCGKQVESGTNFCPYCGKSIQ